MKRDNSLMKFTTFVLLITIVAIALVSGTYAKYATKLTGTDTATVAKWSVTMNGSASETTTFDLFSTINDSNGTDAEEDVTGDKRIAPGTRGKFTIEIENQSEVKVQYGIKFTVAGAAVPLQFKVAGAADWSNSLADIEEQELAKGNTEIVVEWQWPYEGNDATDTALGVASGTVTVTAELTATQVD